MSKPKPCDLATSNTAVCQEASRELADSASSGSASNAVSGSADNDVVGSARNAVSGSADNDVVESARHAVSGSADNVVSGSASKSARGSADDDATRTSGSLIVRAQENDAEAWERIAKLYSPMVYYWCRQSGLAEPDLHDLFQEVFHALARNISSFRPLQNGSFRGWLRTLTRNKLNDHFRALGRQPRASGGTEAQHYLEQLPAVAELNSASDLAKVTCDPSVPGEMFESRMTFGEQEIQHSLLCQALVNVRDSFTEQTWKAFWMVVIDGREAKDVAQDLSMRPGTVRVAKSRVLKRLRLEIGDVTE